MKNWITSPVLHTLLLLSLLGAALFVRTQDYDWIKSLRYQAFDAYNILYPRQPTDKVVIVDIDEPSLQDDRMGQWPWPRSEVAKLVDQLTAMGAKSIVFDIVFAEKDRTSPSVLQEKWNVSDEAAKQMLAALPDPDQVFANSLTQAGDVVMGFSLSDSAAATRDLPALLKPVIMAPGTPNFFARLTKDAGVATNISLLEQASAGIGGMSIAPEVDGIIRQVPLFYSIEGKIYPSLAMEALRTAENPRISHKIRALQSKELSYFSSPLMVKTGRYEIPMDENGLFYVHYAKQRPEKYISAWKVIEGEINPEQIYGKIVLIGTSAQGLKDIRSTPLDLYTSGVEGHLNVIEQILQNDFKTRPRIIQGAELIFAGLVGLVMIVLALFTGALLLAMLAIVMISGITVSSVLLYLHEGLLLDPVYPSLTILALFIFSSLLSYIRAETDRRAIKQAFGLYISQDYMNELSRNPGQLKLGGETREVTVMFSDIRNFTSICEPLQPSEIISLMNEFLTPISDAIMSNKGTIDKYIGDAVMAFWNAPLLDTLHPRNACLAALEIQKRLAVLNQSLEDRKTGIVLRAGIGLNTGEAAVGNMGSEQRFAYSVLGDTVNLASRLESNTKIYGVGILIAEGVYTHVRDMAALCLDVLKVKGKNEPSKIYTLISSDRTASFENLSALQNEMLDLYKNRKFDKALETIAACKKLAPQELAYYYDMMEKRIKNLQSSPPDADWNGVFATG